VYLFAQLLRCKIHQHKKYFFFFLVLALLTSCGASGGKKSSASVQNKASFEDELSVADECVAEGTLKSTTMPLNSEEKAYNEYEKNAAVGKVEPDESQKKDNAEGKIERLLIKTGYVNFETADIRASRSFVEKLVVKYGAYISSEDESTSDKTIKIALNIKIPQRNFDLFLQELEGTERNVSSKRIDTQDVTEEFVDITARLAVKKDAEQTYLRLLSVAKKVQDVLDIQNQLQNIRSEIEGIEARLKYLEKSVAYSTLDVRMYQFIARSDYLPRGTPFFRRILSSIRSGVNIATEVFIAVLNAWVFILIPLVVVALFRLKSRLNKNKKNETTSSKH